MKIITHLESLELQILAETVQLHSSEVKFLGIWWRSGTVCILPETLTTLELMKMPANKKELQHALGLSVFWWKHIPAFSVIAWPLYDLICRRVSWDWTLVHEEALKLLIFLKLGYIRPWGQFIQQTQSPLNGVLQSMGYQYICGSKLEWSLEQHM